MNVLEQLIKKILGKKNKFKFGDKSLSEIIEDSLDKRKNQLSKIVRKNDSDTINEVELDD
jgi:predicted CopG family antitoxin